MMDVMSHRMGKFKRIKYQKNTNISIKLNYENTFYYFYSHFNLFWEFLTHKTLPSENLNFLNKRSLNQS